jgi:hypothetical protein
MGRLVARSVGRMSRAGPSAPYFGTLHPNRKDACGCAMSARFLAAALVISAVWYGWRWQSSGLSLGAMLLWILVWSVLASLAGKIVGIAASKWHAHKSPIKE